MKQKFRPEEHWLVNKWWPLEERESLGDIEAECFVGPGDLSALFMEASGSLVKHAKPMATMERNQPIERTVTLLLSDKRYFRMSIGKRVLKKDLFHCEKGTIPLYSANVEPDMEHGWLKKSNIPSFKFPSLLWSIDSDFNMTARDAGEEFATTDHCGRLEILDPNLDPAYCQAAIVYGYGRTYGFDRTMRPSLTRMKKVSFRVPVNRDGSFDLAAQQELAKEFIAVQEAVRSAEASLETIVELKPKADLPSDAKDLGVQPDFVGSAGIVLSQGTFDELAETWRQETGMLSMMQKKVNHPAYQRIIDMGTPALPFILRELKKKNDHWICALKEITGEDIVKPGSNIKQAIATWLKWGKKNKYL